MLSCITIFKLSIYLVYYTKALSYNILEQCMLQILSVMLDLLIGILRILMDGCAFWICKAYTFVDIMLALYLSQLYSSEIKWYRILEVHSPPTLTCMHTMCLPYWGTLQRTMDRCCTPFKILCYQNWTISYTFDPELICDFSGNSVTNFFKEIFLLRILDCDDSFRYKVVLQGKQGCGYRISLHSCWEVGMGHPCWSPYLR